MRVRVHYRGWVQGDTLDPGAACVLRVLEQAAERGELQGTGELVATVDGYGVVRATVPFTERAELYLQAGDGWDRVLLTARSGHTYEWTWHMDEEVELLNALLEGRAIERTVRFGARVLERSLIVDGYRLDSHGAALRRLIAQLGLDLAHRDQPAL